MADSVEVTHIMSDETGRRIASALESMARGSYLKYDSTAGEYIGIAEWFRSMRDGKVYTVDIPTGATVQCIKRDANAGIAVPTTGTEASASVDPYAVIPPFYKVRVNAYADPDGRCHVTAIEGDGMYRSDGSNGNVFVMAPVLYYSFEDVSDGQYSRLSISDTAVTGFKLQPKARYGDGTLKPCMLYAAYPLTRSGAAAMSCSGEQPRTRDVSHDSLRTICDTANTAYSGKTYDFTWYVYVMFLMKYATKNSQSVFAGCTLYDITRQPTENSTGKSSIKVATGHGFVEGSAIMVGTANTDRNNATAHDVVDYAVIESIDESGGSATLNLDREVTVTTSHYIKTALWPTGACDAVQGDGSPTSCTSGKEPFVIQGIEIAHGMYEVMSGVGLKSTGDGWQVMLLDDTWNEATNLNGYTGTGLYIPASSSADQWNYPLRLTDADGMLVATGTGASTSTGMCDGTYSNKSTATGEREFRSVGYLGSGARAGLFCVYGGNGLSDAGWSIGSRLSVNGRHGGEAA